jgi:hypothetical protein
MDQVVVACSKNLRKLERAWHRVDIIPDTQRSCGEPLDDWKFSYNLSDRRRLPTETGSNAGWWPSQISNDMPFAALELPFFRERIEQ